MSQAPKIPDYSEHAQMCLLASGSMTLGFIARSFPMFRFWLGIVPISVVAVGLAWWGLSNHWAGWREHCQNRVGKVRKYGPAFWDLGRLVEALGPCFVFLLAVVLGALAG